MKIELNLKYWHAYLAAFFVYFCAGWVLTGIEGMPEARVAFLMVIGMFIGIGFAVIAIVFTTENIWGRKIANDA